MKVIKQGKDPQEIPWQGECVNCKSVMEALPAELDIERDMKEGGRFGRATCPVCKHEVIFYPND